MVILLCPEAFSDFERVQSVFAAARVWAACRDKPVLAQRVSVPMWDIAGNRANVRKLKAQNQIKFVPRLAAGGRVQMVVQNFV